MNLDALKRLVAQGESERLELKRSTGQRTEAAKTVCALLNGLGGFVLFGVTDRGEITGQQVSARTLDEVVNELHRIEPLLRRLGLVDATGKGRGARWMLKGVQA